MADITQAVQNLKDQYAAMADRVTADVAELRRLIEEGASDKAAMAAAVAAIEETAAQMAGIDPEPNFPAQPHTPTPDDGGTTPSPDGGEGPTPDDGGVTPAPTPDDGGEGPAPDGSPTA